MPKHIEVHKAFKFRVIAAVMLKCTYQMDVHGPRSVAMAMKAERICLQLQSAGTFQAAMHARGALSDA